VVQHPNNGPDSAVDTRNFENLDACKWVELAVTDFKPVTVGTEDGFCHAGDTDVQLSEGNVRPQCCGNLRAKAELRRGRHGRDLRQVIRHGLGV
jgi:hypothetical protein